MQPERAILHRHELVSIFLASDDLDAVLPVFVVRVHLLERVRGAALHGRPCSRITLSRWRWPVIDYALRRPADFLLR
jgi:hypothetical protein